MITLYGIAASRAFRCLWMLEELGLDYRHEPVDYRDRAALDDPGYRALNPNGRIPTLVDGDLVLWESMAINLYLARRYGTEAGLHPDGAQNEGRALQWSFWVMTEVEQPLLKVLLHRRLLPRERRDPQQAARNEGILRQPFAVLDAALAQADWLAGERFTVADLNVAAVLGWAQPARLSLKPWPALYDWLGRCLDRPARRRAQAR